MKKNFNVRIEMHGATRAQYEQLHERMERGTYCRYLRGVDPDGQAGTWQLPSAEYTIFCDATADQVRQHAKAIADSVHPDSWCYVTQVADFSISSNKVA